MAARGRGESLVRFLPLDALPVRDLWLHLAASGHVRSPFETWQWVSALRDVPACSAAVRVALVEIGSRPAGLLALEWDVGTDGLRTVGPAGWRWLAPDHVDVLAAPDDREPVARAVLAGLRDRRDWDVLDLDGLRPDGALARAVRTLVAPRFLHRRPEPIPVPYVDLRDVDPAVPFRSRSLRSQVGRGLRTAQRSGGGLRVATLPQDVEGRVEELARLHTARFGASSALFATEPRLAFHRLAAARLAEAGMAVIYELQAEGRTAALVYVLRLREVDYFYTLGTDPTVGLSPGRTSCGQAVLAAAQAGAQEFDLLRGDHDYKLRFASAVRSEVRLRVVRPTRRTLVLGVARGARSVARRWRTGVQPGQR